MLRVGEDVAEKLDYVPGVFTVERHIRGKWACAKCETLTQVPVDPHVIDKGIPTTGLLAQVLVAKYADHLPLYRQEAIFGRAGLANATELHQAQGPGALAGHSTDVLVVLRDALVAPVDLTQQVPDHGVSSAWQVLQAGQRPCGAALRPAMQCSSVDLPQP
jgi:hypothetical protein